MPVGFTTTSAATSKFRFEGTPQLIGWDTPATVLTYGSTISNTSVITATHRGVPTINVPSTPSTITLTAPTATTSKTVSDSTVVMGQTVTWNLAAASTSDVPVQNFTVSDTIAPNLAVSRVLLPSTFTNSPGGSFITVKYTRSDTGATVHTWTGGPFAAGATLNVSALALPTGAYLSSVRFECGTVPALFATTAGTGTFRFEAAPIPTGWNAGATALAVGGTVANTSRVTGNYNSSPIIDVTSSPASITIIAPTATTSKTVSDATVIAGQTVTWSLAAASTSDVPLQNFTVVDVIAPNLAVSRLLLPSTFTSSPGGSFITVKYTRSDTGVTLHTWTGGPFAAGATLDVSALGLPGGAYVSSVRFECGTVPALFATTAGTGMFRVEAAPLVAGWDTPSTTLVSGAPITNASRVTADAANAPSIDVTSTPASTTFSLPTVFPRVDKSVISTGTFYPGSTVRYQVSVSNLAGADSALVNPVGLDLLSPNVDYVPGSLAQITTGTFNSSGAAAPTVEAIANYDGTGRTLLRWTYAASFAADTRATVEFDVVIKNSAPVGTLANVADVAADPAQHSGKQVTYNNTTVVDTNDLDGDANRTESIGVSSVNVTVVAATVRPSVTKSVVSTGPYPAGAATVRYRVVVSNQNTATSSAVNPVGIDLLPAALTYVPASFTQITGGTNNTSGAPSPVGSLQVLTNYGTTGRTLLRWTYAGNFAPNTVATVEFSATIAAGTAAGTLANFANVAVDPAVQPGTVTYGTPITDTNDLDGDTNVTESIGNSATSNVTVVAPVANPRVVKTERTAAPYYPGSTVTYRVKVRNHTAANVPLINPMGMDLLPASVDYVPGSFVRITSGSNNSSGAPSPVASLQVLPNYAGTGRTLLRWSYAHSFPVDTEATIDFSVILKPDAAAGTLTNDSYVSAGAPAQVGTITYSNTSKPVDANDLDGDANSTEIIGHMPISVTVSLLLTNRTASRAS